jgi:hypothetical protein
MNALRRRRLVRRLAGANEQRRWEAATALSADCTPATLRRVERLVEGRGRPEGRAAAAYVLGFAGSDDAAAVLARRLGDPDEKAMVRAYAAEALGHLLQLRPVVADVRLAVLAGLRDRQEDVRFWSAFAAASLDLQETRRELEQLRKDTTPVAGWWTVAQEAQWALRCLDGEENPPSPDRL